MLRQSIFSRRNHPINTDKIIKLSFLIFVSLLVGAFLLLVKKLLIPFIFSFLLAYILSPLVTYLEAKGIRRGVVVTLLYAGAVVVCGVLVFLFGPKIIDEIGKLQDNMGMYITTAKTFIQAAKDFVLQLPMFSSTSGRNFLEQTIFPKIATASAAMMANVPHYVMGLLSTVSLLFLIPFISFFILLEGKNIVNTIFANIPARHIETALSLVCEIDETIGRYLRGQILDALCVATLTIIGLSILGVDQAFILGGLVGLGNLVPYLGTVIGGAPTIIIVLLKTQSMLAVAKVIAMFMIVQFCDNHFIAPFVVGNTVQAHPVAIMTSLLIGGYFFGPLGMLFAVPTYCILKVIVQVLWRYFVHTEHTGVAPSHGTMI